MVLGSNELSSTSSVGPSICQSVSINTVSVCLTGHHRPEVNSTKSTQMKSFWRKFLFPAGLALTTYLSLRISSLIGFVCWCKLIYHNSRPITAIMSLLLYTIKKETRDVPCEFLRIKYHINCESQWIICARRAPNCLVHVCLSDAVFLEDRQPA